MAKHTFTTIAIASLLALPLGACQAPLNTRRADAQLAGRCKLMAYGEDRPHFAIGLSAAIVQANVDQHRQEIYDSCVAAEGGRERPAEVP